MNMKNYLDNNNIVEILKEIFPEVEINLERVSYCGSISVFLITINSAVILNSIWNKISSTIAAYYQAYLDNDFEKWNVYLIYICKEAIDISLTYRIENDRFSTRKIVLVNELELNQADKNDIISSYITNKDIDANTSIKTNVIDNYKSDSIVWKAISDSQIKLKKTNNSEIEVILEGIENQLDNED